MRPILLLIPVLAACGGGGGGGSSAPSSHWPAIRAHAMPALALTAEFGTPAVQPLASDGWEDGIWISRDGLHLFCTYAPADLLSLTIDDPTQLHSADYLRGPTHGMDLVTNPAGRTSWVHGDIMHATRASTSARFTAWQTTGLSQPVTSEGAPQGLDPSGSGWGIFAFTTNAVAPYKAQIAIVRGASFDPSGTPTILPTVNSAGLTSDNPHLERIDASHLVLFFDSADRGGPGGLDLWYATSADDGASWTAPAAVASLDTAADEEQPHLYNDGSDWWLYFTATNPGDGKLGIFRAKATAAGWDSWGARELVVGAGTTEGVGEPSLTTAGDLSFVAVYRDPDGTATNRYDADPWFAPHKPSGVGMRGARDGQVVAGR